MKITADVDKSLEKATRLLEGIPKGIEKATIRAFNRALQQGRTVATKETTKRYTAKAKDIRPTFKMIRAGGSNMEAELVSTGSRLPLTRFRYSPMEDTTGSNRKQIRVSVKKGGLKPLGNMFVWKGKIMHRLGDTGLPIQQKFGAAVPVMLNNEDIVEAVNETMMESASKRLEHETLRLLEGNQ